MKRFVSTRHDLPVLGEKKFNVDNRLILSVQHLIQFEIQLGVLHFERVTFDFQFLFLTDDQFQIIFKFIDLEKGRGEGYSKRLGHSHSFIGLFQALQENALLFVVSGMDGWIALLVQITTQPTSVSFLSKDLRRRIGRAFRRDLRYSTERSPLTSFSSPVSSSIRVWRVSFSS